MCHVENINKLMPVNAAVAALVHWDPAREDNHSMLNGAK